MTGPSTHKSPRICCLDLDTFFVSVERLFDPSLVGRPVVVGGRPGGRGVVTAASYEVREFGVKSGMSMAEATRLAPQAVFVPPRHGVYSDYSSRVRAIVERFCPRVQAASIDEFYLDFAGCERLYRAAGDVNDDATTERVVRTLTGAIMNELGLPASAGIGTCKAVAKVACRLAKPRGVLLVPGGSEAGFLAPLPVRYLPGIGPVGEQRLLRLGIATLGELARREPEELREHFGKWARVMVEGARGIGPGQLGRDRPAFREHDPHGATVGSISNECTFSADSDDPSHLLGVLAGLCERVCYRARKRCVQAGTVTLKLRYGDFTTLTRSRSISPSNSELEIFPVLKQLFARARSRPAPVRLLGVALHNLDRFGGQLRLFGGHQRLHAAVDDIRQRFGYGAVHLASAQSRWQGQRDDPPGGKTTAITAPAADRLAPGDPRTRAPRNRGR